jgi:hypothetical protein
MEGENSDVRFEDEGLRRPRTIRLLVVSLVLLALPLLLIAATLPAHGAGCGGG